MASLKGIKLCGVRSVSPNDAILVGFSSPLTLIVGDNGSGKTTIIESLKYMCTGQLPVDSKNVRIQRQNVKKKNSAFQVKFGHSFVHDLKLTEDHQVKAQVKLWIAERTKSYVFARSFQVAQRATKSDFKTLEAIGIAKDGETKSTIAHTCSGVLDRIATILGVSTAILEYVIFCPQEETNWPLGESKELKKRFDDIFASSRYSKALEHIKAVKKELESSKQALKIAIGRYDGELVASAKLEQDIRNKESAIDVLEKKNQEIDRTLRDKHQTLKNHQDVRAQLDGSFNSMKVLREELKQYTETRGVAENLYKHLKDEVLSARIQNSDEDKNARESTLRDLTSQRNNLEESKEQILTQIQVLNTKVSAVKYQQEAMESCSINLIKALKPFYDESFPLIDQKALPTILWSKPSTEDLRLAAVVLRDFSSAKLKEMATYFNVEKEQLEAQSTLVAELQAKESKDKLEKARLSRSLESHTSKLKEQRSILETKRQKQAELACLKSSLNLKTKRLDSLVSAMESQSLQRTTSVSTWERIAYLLESYSSETDIICNLNSVKRSKKETKNEIFSHFQTIQDTNKLIAIKERIIQSIVGASEIEDMRSLLNPGFLSQLLAQITARIKELRSMDTNSVPLQQDYYFTKGKLEFADNYISRLQVKEMDIFDEMRRSFPNASLQSLSDQELQALVAPLLPNPDIANLWYSLNIIKEELQHLYDLSQDLQAKLSSLDFTDERKAILGELISGYDTVQEILSNIHVTCITKLAQLNDQATTLRSRLENLNFKPFATTTQVDDRFSDLKFLCQPPLGWIPTLDEVSCFIHQTSTLRISIGDKPIKQFCSAIVFRCHDEIHNLENNNKSEIDEQNQLKNDILELRESIAALEVESAIGLLEKEIEELTNTFDLERSELDTVEVSLGQIESTLNESILELERLKSRRAYYVRLNWKLPQLHAELESAHDEWTSLYSQSASQNLDSLYSELSQLQSKKTQVEADINQTIAQIEFQKATDMAKTDVSLQEELVNRRRKRKLAALEAEVKQKYATGTLDDLSQIIASLNSEISDLNNLKNHNEGALTTHKSHIESLRTSVEQESVIRLQKAQDTNKLNCILLAQQDLEVYMDSIEKALSKYHNTKMENINRRLKELWEATYKGGDIDFLKIIPDNEQSSSTSKAQKNFNYRVVMVKSGIELDMRGRCSAGQKVLACLLIRLALADSFCSSCGILALDEPTTNLDRANVEGLAESLNQLILTRKKQRNFQLIVITHDEHFVEILGRSTNTNEYYKVKKNADRHTVVERRSMQDLRQ